MIFCRKCFFFLLLEYLHVDYEYFSYCGYSEEDLDDILILQTKLYNCAHSFLGRSGFAGNLRGNNLLGSLPQITSRVHSNAATSEQCKCTQPNTTRLSKAPRT